MSQEIQQEDKKRATEPKPLDPFTLAFQNYMAYLTQESQVISERHDESISTLAFFMALVRDATWKNSPKTIRPILFDPAFQIAIDKVASTLAPIIDMQVQTFELPLLKEKGEESLERIQASPELGNNLPAVNITNVQPSAAKSESAMEKIAELPAKIVEKVRGKVTVADDPSAILGETHKSKSAIDDLKQVPRVWNKYVKWHNRTMKRLDVLERSIKDPASLKKAYSNAQSEETEFFEKLEPHILGGNRAHTTFRKKELETSMQKLLLESLDLMRAREEATWRTQFRSAPSMR